jgi:hypothetical protein
VQGIFSGFFNFLLTPIITMRDLSAHILDIAQNSTAAGATRIDIDVMEDGSFIDIRISDNGHGMNASTLARVFDPFFTSRTTRKVGLGMPLLMQNARQTGGDVTIDSTPGEGTTATARFVATHIDCPPWGDLPLTIALLASGYPRVRWVYNHHKNGRNYCFDTDEVMQTLGDVSLQHPRVVTFMTEMIRENLTELSR